MSDMLHAICKKKKPQIDFDLDEIELFRETASGLGMGNVSIYLDLRLYNSNIIHLC